MDVLRAMIDSSGTVEPTGGFDLEAARVDVATASARRFSESREHARIFCAEEILPDALDEIERLRADLEQSERVIEARLEVIDQQVARILELEAEVLQKSLLCDSIVENCNSLRDRARKAEARIEGLENALSEYQRLGKTIAGRLPCLVLHGDCGRCSAGAREVCGALEQIAEGKIGPDAGVAHKECKECSDERLLASLVEHENQTHAILGAILGTDNTLENVAKRAMTRIAELEKWLKEERAGAIRTESYDHCEGMYTIDLPDAMIRAQQELQSEGKIGPGTVAPPCWLLRGDFQSREELSEEQAEVDAIAEKGA